MVSKLLKRNSLGKKSLLNYMIDLTVIVPVKNEIEHISRCLTPIIGKVAQIIVVDSGSTDGTVEYCRSLEQVELLNFNWNGEWPKKRQWVLNNYEIKGSWTLLLDADEVISEPNLREINKAISKNKIGAFWVPFDVYFGNRLLRYGDSRLYKMSLFRTGSSGYVRQVDDDSSNLDMEVHEHLQYNGSLEVDKLKLPVAHYSVHSLSRMILKYNDYSDWEVKKYYSNRSLNKQRHLTNQAKFRKMAKRNLIRLPGADRFYFYYLFIIRLGFIDGLNGYHRAKLQSQQIWMIQAKIWERAFK